MSGPWTIRYAHARPVEIVVENDHYQSVALLPSSGKETDAQMIVAAPEMLAACKAIDDLLLVIESAVRFSDRKNHEAVVKALVAVQAAVALAERQR